MNPLYDMFSAPPLPNDDELDHLLEPFEIDAMIRVSRDDLIRAGYPEALHLSDAQMDHLCLRAATRIVDQLRDDCKWRTKSTRARLTHRAKD